MARLNHGNFGLVNASKPLIERRFPPTTNRSVEHVAQLHGIPLREFWGKTILDLGCGLSDLQLGLDRQGIEATVIGIDLKALELSRAVGSQIERNIVAKLGSLPIPTESIDLAIATYSLPHYGSSAEEIDDFFAECKRVVKIGGLLSIAPLFVNVDLGTDHITEDFESRELTTQMQVEAIHHSSDWVSTVDWDRGLTALKIR